MLDNTAYPSYALQESVWRHCSGRQIALTAHRPLSVGKLADDATLTAIGMEHGKSAAQVSLRWLVQRQVVAIPKASSSVIYRRIRISFRGHWTKSRCSDSTDFKSLHSRIPQD
jgi:diketogulonate reductase-like aldo/keto reductase